MCVCVCVCILFQILFHYSLLQDIEYSSLWYTVGPRLFIYFWYAVLSTAAASPVAEHRLRTCRLSGHGSRAQPLRGMRDPPGPGHEPASPASAGGPSTTAPPGKPLSQFFNIKY